MITDLTPYRKYVDQFDLTEEQKLEWVNALLMIVESILARSLSHRISQGIAKRNRTPKLAVSLGFVFFEVFKPIFEPKIELT